VHLLIQVEQKLEKQKSLHEIKDPHHCIWCLVVRQTDISDISYKQCCVKSVLAVNFLFSVLTTILDTGIHQFW